jgi:hypothetical protein
MIPNHDQFVEAIHAKKKVGCGSNSKADSGVLDRVCAPLDYGPGAENKDGLNRYWFWDDTSNPDVHTRGLVPQQVVELQVLGEVFDPAQLPDGAPQWLLARREQGIGPGSSL